MSIRYFSISRFLIECYYGCGYTILTHLGSWIVTGNKEWPGGQNGMNVPQLLPGAVLPQEGAAAASTKEVLALLDSYQTLLFGTLEERAELQEMEGEKR